ncbi:hypothetical protein L1049_022681 [Liquidambar formosana]|uniref:Uncharacterized protein n=1 Tax=Liquidambar formosana TaxID=63359 RepID=A0AAP0RE81_LIQFO
MAFYVDEEEVWKCQKHPSKRRRSGICPICLRERLLTLCPDCANVRPCACCTSSSSSSSSSSFSRFATGVGGDGAGVGSVGRLSNLIESEPSFRRSRSLAIPFLRSATRSRFFDRDSGDGRPPPPPDSNRSRSSFWSVFKTQRSKKTEEGGEERERDEVNEDAKRIMMMRSQSVGIPVLSGSGGRDARSGKGRGWHFPSPIKAFRQSKAAKVVQERSPLYRG